MQSGTGKRRTCDIIMCGYSAWLTTDSRQPPDTSALTCAIDIVDKRVGIEDNTVSERARKDYWSAVVGEFMVHVTRCELGIQLGDRRWGRADIAGSSSPNSSNRGSKVELGGRSVREAGWD